MRTQVATRTRPAARRRAGGRPPKFDEPRRPVTVTLPERTLRRLRSVDPDLARAIVKAAEAIAGAAAPGRDPVELVPLGSGTALLLVPPLSCLRRTGTVRLVEVTPGRHLIAVAPGTPVESLEVALLDLADNLPPEEEHERPVLSRLLEVVRRWRRLARVSKLELLFVPPGED